MQESLGLIDGLSHMCVNIELNKTKTAMCTIVRGHFFLVLSNFRM